MRLTHLACVALIIIGVFSENCWSAPEDSESSPVMSSCLQGINIDHCHSSPEGVHDLDCYRQQSEQMTRCVWKPGKQSSNKTTYTLIIEQKDRDFCEYKNISKMTHLFDPFKMNEMTAYVIDGSSDERNCTMAIFTGTPAHLVRCGPPARIIFKRHSRQLAMQVSWTDKYVNKFLVEYRELNSLPWKEGGSCKKKKCVVANLTSSLSYEVKVQCVVDSLCRQCPWSNVSIVPPELTIMPVIEKFDVIPQKMGKRLIIAHWKLPKNESVSGYRVVVGKESGEFYQTFNVTDPVLRLILSGSAYYINISAFNSAGTSPPALRKVPITNAQSWDLNGSLNITFRSTSEFEISWNHSLTRTYCCYSVDWGLKGEMMSSHSLHRKSSNNDVISLEAPLQPHKRYVFLLHTRPDKDTCNLKSINDSESTNGRTEAYAREGTPTSPPGNITCFEVASTSLSLAWSAVTEEDACGFILGYIIYYSENGKEQNSSVVIDDAGANNFTLSNLKSQTTYEVQLSAFTAIGEGVRSTSFYFDTAGPETWAVETGAAGIVGGVMLLLLVAKISSVLWKRAKKLFWPSIPNPGNSNAIQKIDGAFELDVLQPLSMAKLAQLEESDTSSLLIVEGTAETLPAPANHVSVPDRDELSPAGSAAEEQSPSPSLWRARAQAPSPAATETAERQAAALPAASDYTTMELFQQTMARPLGRPPPSGYCRQASLTMAPLQDRPPLPEPCGQAQLLEPCGPAQQASSTHSVPEHNYIRESSYHPHPSNSSERTDELSISAL